MGLFDASKTEFSRGTKIYIYEVDPKKNDTFSIEQKLMKVQKKIPVTIF